MSLIPSAPFTDHKESGTQEIRKNSLRWSATANTKLRRTFVRVRVDSWLRLAEAGRIEMSRYLIVIEETGTGYSAYSPDLPGCIATGKTRDSVEREMHDAIEFHLDGLRRAGEPIPSPRSEASYCEVGV